MPMSVVLRPSPNLHAEEGCMVMHPQFQLVGIRLGRIDEKYGDSPIFGMYHKVAKAGDDDSEIESHKSSFVSRMVRFYAANSFERSPSPWGADCGVGALDCFALDGAERADRSLSFSQETVKGREK